MSDEPRLKAGLWVRALVRACLAQGITATVARRGDPDAGAVLIKQNLLGGGFRVLSQVRTGDGRAAWLRAGGDPPITEAVADAYIARQIDRDWDLWVVEIEDRDGRLPLGGEIVAE